MAFVRRIPLPAPIAAARRAAYIRDEGNTDGLEPEKGGMHFRPDAKLDTSQVEDRRGWAPPTNTTTGTIPGDVDAVRALAIQQRQASASDFARRGAMIAASAQRRQAAFADMQLQQQAAERQARAAKDRPAASPAKSPNPLNSSWGDQTSAFQDTMTGLRHSGGYRSAERNAQVNGAKNSAHMVQDGHGNAKANDYVGSEDEMQAGAARARSMGARQVMVHDAGSGRHLHIEWS